MSNIHFYAYEDTEDDNMTRDGRNQSYVKGLMNIIVFATEDEVNSYDEDTGDILITGEHLYIDNDLHELFDDTGMLCEEYLIHTMIPIASIRCELESRGYIWNDTLINAGWG